MKYLSNQSVLKAQEWISNKGRDVEVALFEILNSGLEKELILDALSMYLNEDNGYGNGLDPNIMMDYSCPMACLFALDYIKMAGFTSVDMKDDFARELVIPALKYCFIDMKQNHMTHSPKELKNYPHSPSMRIYDEDEVYGYHPTIGILAHCLYYAKKDTPLFKQALSLLEVVQNHILKKDTSISFDELCDYVALYDVLKKKYPELIKEESWNEIKNLVKQAIQEDERLSIEIFGMNDPYEGYENAMSNAFDHLIETINHSGVWDIEEKWDSPYEDDGVYASIKLAAIRTTKYIEILKKYHRITE